MPRLLTVIPATALAASLVAVPVQARAADGEIESFTLEEQSGGAAQEQPQSDEQGPPAGPPEGNGAQGSPPPFQMQKPVFDETWATIGLGAGLVPSYAGSDDYVLFPLPLIVGRVGGVGISPNGPGFVLDFNSPKPSLGPAETRLNFGPAFRIRNDRVNQIEDAVVEQLPDLDLAVEVGGNVGVSIPGVLGKFDSLTLSTQVRWDVAGAHEGMLIEPSVGYRAPIGRGTLIQVNAGLQFVDDSFADYYYTVTPAQSAASGLPVFNADGGLNSVGTVAIVSFDLDGNALNGGFSIYTVLGYSRLVGDGADTPFTSVRGDANQFLGGIGVGYTF